MKPITGPADVIVAAVASRGSNPRDLRDAAHEACHALMFNVKPGTWDRETINGKIERTRNGHAMARIMYGRRFGVMIDAEVIARAVEQVVCKRFGVDCGTVEEWAHIAWMEAMQNSRILLPDGLLPTAIRKAMEHDRRVGLLADKTVALTAWKPRARKAVAS